MVQGIRSQLAENEEAALVMDALRGKNMNDDDAQAAGVQMRLVDASGSETLKTDYDPEALGEFFSKRPLTVINRIAQVAGVGGGWVLRNVMDKVLGRSSPDLEVQRAGELRDVITSLGPFYIKIGQALSIRPDVLSPRSMVELQKLCDKVPSFDSKIAFETIERELGKSVDEIFSEITPEPVAAVSFSYVVVFLMCPEKLFDIIPLTNYSYLLIRHFLISKKASLGQVYKATLRETGETVAVKVQRPGVLETVSLDLYLAREAGLIARTFPFLTDRLDAVALLDEFAYRFYQELDYNLECENGLKIREQMKILPSVVIPDNYPQYTSRRVHVAEWIEGEKLSQSKADDVGALVNLGVITYLTQLLEYGFFHAE